MQVFVKRVLSSSGRYRGRWPAGSTQGRTYLSVVSLPNELNLVSCVADADFVCMSVP